jgi:hypothetical protein
MTCDDVDIVGFSFERESGVDDETFGATDSKIRMKKQNSNHFSFRQFNFSSFFA